MLLLMLFLVFTTTQAAQHNLPSINIGIITDGPTPLFQLRTPLFQEEINALTKGEFDIRYPKDMQLDGNSNRKDVNKALDNLLANKDVDLILALGPVASNQAAKRKHLNKPVISPLIFDAELQGIPHVDDVSGVKNLSYLVSFHNYQRDIAVFHELFKFKKLTVLVDSMLLEAIPQLKNKAVELAKQGGFSISLLVVGESEKVFIDKLPTDTDAIYITRLLQLTPKGFSRLIKEINQQHLPSFSLMGQEDVEKGVLAGLAPTMDLTRLARRVALYIQRILKGENAENLPINFPRQEVMSINMATARTIGFSPPWSIINNAYLINEEDFTVDRKLDFISTLIESQEQNLEIASTELQVLAASENLRLTRSQLLPQVNAKLQSIYIDADRADASLGTMPERLYSAAISLSQNIYSYDKQSSFEIEKKHFQQNQAGFHQQKLDIIYQTALSYIDVLRTKRLHNIETENLKLSRSHLKLARVRRKLGVSGSSEVYRWESKIATDRQQVLHAQADRRLSEMRLNRLLNREINEPFITKEIDLSNPGLIVNNNKFFQNIDNPQQFALFQDFMVQEGLSISPEITQINASIAAQKQKLQVARRAYWSPEVTLQGSLSQTLDQQNSEKPAAIAGLGFPEKNDTDWTVSLTASLPLSTGGARRAHTAKATATLRQLQIDKQFISQILRERIRSSLQKTRASHPSIELSRDAANAAQKNLQLVTDAYARGKMSVTELLDAQNLALVAEQNASVAVYGFLIDLMSVYRAIGRFDFLTDTLARDACFDRLDKFLAQQKTMTHYNK